MHTIRIGVLCTLIIVPSFAAAASADYYLKLDGVEGESTKSAASSRASVAAPTTTDPTGASSGGYLKIEGVEGESSAKGEVEMERKVEKGESSTQSAGVEREEIGVMSDDPQPLTPDFSILLGGGDDTEEDKGHKGEILLESLREADAAIESISLHFDKITAGVRSELFLLGFIPLSSLASVEVDAKGETLVRFPWWAVFATGKDGESLGARVVEALMSKHDTIKNAIQNIR